MILSDPVPAAVDDSGLLTAEERNTGLLRVGRNCLYGDIRTVPSSDIMYTTAGFPARLTALEDGALYRGLRTVDHLRTRNTRHCCNSFLRILARSAQWLLFKAFPVFIFSLVVGADASQC